ncbi:hypothetical protein EAF04_005098 [Stromatinia cepivora]|nr:hypothetical protein EAF04_005098 [Stromatinia cepivora]
MSNVNSQLRLELGSVIWARSSIHCLGGEDEMALESFLDARPGTWQGIKELSILIGDENKYKPHFDDTRRGKAAANKFIALMEFLSKRSIPECLILDLGGTMDSLKALAAGEGPLKALTSITKLKVTQSFVFELGYIAFSDDLDVDDGYPGLKEAFTEKWESKIRKVLMPMSLQSTTSQTNQYQGHLC